MPESSPGRAPPSAKVISGGTPAAELPRLQRRSDAHARSLNRSFAGEVPSRGGPVTLSSRRPGNPSDSPETTASQPSAERAERTAIVVQAIHPDAQLIGAIG